MSVRGRRAGSATTMLFVCSPGPLKPARASAPRSAGMRPPFEAIATRVVAAPAPPQRDPDRDRPQHEPGRAGPPSVEDRPKLDDVLLQVTGHEAFEELGHRELATGLVEAASPGVVVAQFAHPWGDPRPVRPDAGEQLPRR